VVSTEDEEIASISMRYGATVIKRPIKLAQDDTPTIDVLQHVLQSLDLKSGIVVLLEPTSPIRRTGLIDKCIQRFLDTKADSLATGFMCKYTAFGSTTKRRQDIEGFFYPDGCVYIYKAENILDGDLFGSKKVMVHTTREEQVEIDDEFDFWLAEQVLKKIRWENEDR
jgi:CMP-N-acetylneuraminic acid synthetase